MHKRSSEVDRTNKKMEMRKMAWAKIQEVILTMPIGSVKCFVRRNTVGRRERTFSFDQNHFWQTKVEALAKAETLTVKTGEHMKYGYPVAVYQDRPNPYK